MDEYVFEDVLANSTVTCTYPDLRATRVAHGISDADERVAADNGERVAADAQDGEQLVAEADERAADAACESLFFPGCSFLNYGLPLVKAVYDLLHDAGRVGGISLLCCGKILQYEDPTGDMRAAFEQQLREHIVAAGVKRIVAACPNCVGALRPLLEADPATADVQVVALPAELVEMGYRVDAGVAEEMIRADERVGADGPAIFCAKDSCPDHKTGEFAEALRAIMPEGMVVDPEHNRSKSICCGSRPRAAGNMKGAQKCTRMNADEALAAGAGALVTACVSCTFLLSTSQRDLPVFHYLELLYNWRIAWDYADQYMKLRFLFDDALGTREFKGLG